MPSLTQAGEKDKATPATAPSERELTLHAIDTYFGQTRSDLRIDLSALGIRPQTTLPCVDVGYSLEWYDLSRKLNYYFVVQQH